MKRNSTSTSPKIKKKIRNYSSTASFNSHSSSPSSQKTASFNYRSPSIASTASYRSIKVKSLPNLNIKKIINDRETKSLPSKFKQY